MKTLAESQRGPRGRESGGFDRGWEHRLEERREGEAPLSERSCTRHRTGRGLQICSLPSASVDGAPPLLQVPSQTLGINRDRTKARGFPVLEELPKIGLWKGISHLLSPPGAGIRPHRRCLEKNPDRTIPFPC